MNRQPVHSKNLESVGYDPKALRLEIEFKNGSVYQYEGVPGEMHSALMQAPSQGSFFNRNIKDRFPFQRTR